MENLKKWLKRAAGAVVFLAILAVMVLRLDSALKLIQEDNLCGRYYDYPDDTFDVTFLGSSFALYGIYPMELYRDFGIASYNLSTGNQSIEASYYLAKESIEKDHPELIVMDCNMAWVDQETMKSQYIHYITDTMPYLSKSRLEIIRNLAEEGEDLKPIMFPLIAYHSRWQELTYEDALPQAKEMVYGCKVTSRVEISNPFKEPKYVEGVTVPKTSVKYLQKIHDLCRENDTELLLINIPVLWARTSFLTSPVLTSAGLRRRRSARLRKRTMSPIWSILPDGRNWDLTLTGTPWTESTSTAGIAVRFTSFLGNYMKEHYDLPDRRGTGGAYAVIDEDLVKYPVSRMRDSLRRALFLRDYAAALRSDASEAEGAPVEDALVLITLNGMVNDDILTEEQAKVIQGFGIQQDLSELETHSWLAVIDGGKLVYETVPGEEDSTDAFEGTAGVLNYRVTSGRVEEETGNIRSGASITVNTVEYTSDNRGLHFAVFDKTTGELLDACWLDINSYALSCVHDNH